MTQFYGPNPDNSSGVSLIYRNSLDDKSLLAVTPQYGRFIVMISAFSLIVVIIFFFRSRKHSRNGMGINFLRRGMSNNRDTFDLGRLLEDPEKSGFNRVATHEVDDADGDQTDSEVEEFNVTSVKRQSIVT